MKHALSRDERAAFERDGYVMVSGALDAATVTALRAAAEQHDHDYRRQDGITSLHVLNLHDLIGREPVFLDIVDNPATFPKVFGILGWNIQCFHTQLVVTPPSHPEAPAGGYGWHQDNNRMNRDFETPPPHPRVSVKVGYFVTDLGADDMGNLMVVPGSHRRGRPELDVVDTPPDAVSLRARAGDAIIFDRRLWHAASTNRSDRTRVFVTFGYAYRWLRPKSAMALDALYAQCDPIRRQLLGAMPTGANGCFDPSEEDVPLRTWIRAHLGDQAVIP